MFKNNNSKAISQISSKKMKTNRARNLLIIIAIILTSVLLTSVMTVTMSIVKSAEYTTMRQIGSKAHGAFKTLTPEQYDILSKHKNIKKKGKSTILGLVVSDELARRQIEIRHMDKQELEFSFVQPLLSGNLPEERNEILLDTLTLDMLGLDYELDQQISLELDINDMVHNETFKLVGIYKGDTLAMASYAVVSTPFTDEYLKDVDIEKNIGSGTMTGAVSLNVALKSTFNIIAQLQEILLDSGFELDEIKVGVNWAYVGNNATLQIEDLISFILFIGLIMGSGYLIIYNIFYIAITKDIKFYGLLKTVGTTSKQIRALVIRQALLLSAIGIPIGLLLGYGLGRLLVPYVVDSLTMPGVAISMHPLIFIISGLLTLITLLVSCRKPAKIAAKVSPLEAIRTVDTNKNKGKKKRRSHGNKIHLMAWHNLFREKRKALLVVLSLSLSLIVLNVAFIVTSNVDEEMYLKDTINSDYTFGSVAYYRSEYNHHINGLDESFINMLSEQDGVEKSIRLYGSTAQVPISESVKRTVQETIVDQSLGLYHNARLQENKLATDIFGLNEDGVDQLLPYVTEGYLDFEKFNQGSAVVLFEYYYTDQWMTKVPYEVGDFIHIEGANGKEYSYEVMALVHDLPRYLYDGNAQGYGLSLYMSSNQMKGSLEKAPVMTLMLDINDNKKPQFDTFIPNSIKTYPSLDYRNRAYYIKELKQFYLMIRIVGFSLSSVLGLIGILNFINVSITNVIVRRQEYAMLQSIGMTFRQLFKMLVFESLYIIAVTVTAASVLSLPIGKNICEGIPFISYTSTLLPLMITLPLLLALAVLIPFISYSMLKKDSLVDRLRVVE